MNAQFFNNYNIEYGYIPITKGTIKLIKPRSKLQIRETTEKVVVSNVLLDAHTGKHYGIIIQGSDRSIITIEQLMSNYLLIKETTKPTPKKTLILFYEDGTIAWSGTCNNNSVMNINILKTGILSNEAVIMEGSKLFCTVSLGYLGLSTSICAGTKYIFQEMELKIDE